MQMVDVNSSHEISFCIYLKLACSLAFDGSASFIFMLIEKFFLLLTIP